MRIYQLFPQPSPVTLAGRRYLAMPLRLVHVARLETWMASQSTCPVDAYREAIREAEGRERRVIAAQAYLAAEHWPPRTDGTDAERMLLTPIGMRLFLEFTIGPCNVLSEQDYGHIIAKITRDEFEALTKLAYGLAPLDEMAVIIEQPAPHPYAPDKAWSETIWEVVEDTGWTIAAVEQLFLCQVMFVRTKGKAGSGQMTGTNGPGRFAAAAERRAIFAEAEERNNAEQADG